MQALFYIDQLPDLFVDACIVDGANLVFISIWGRDTAIQELLGRATLQNHERSLDFITLKSNDVHGSFDVALTRVDDLIKKSARVQSHTFGQLTNLWIYSRQCVEPDRAHRKSYVIRESGQMDSLWGSVVDLCPYPLLDTWKDPVMEILTKNELITSLTTVVGHINGWRLSLGDEVIAVEISQLIQAGRLTPS